MAKPPTVIIRIRSLCAVLLLFFAFSALFALPARAEEPIPVFRTAQSSEALRRGDTFKITLSPAQSGLSAFVLFAEYDPDDIVKAAASCSDKDAYLYTADQDGRLAVVYTSKGGGAPLETGLLTLTFRTSDSALSDAVPVCITVTDAAASDASALLHAPEQYEFEASFEPEPASDCALVSLTPPAGTLVPEFDPEILDYTLEVPFSSVSLVFDAVPTEGASVRVNRKNLGAGGSTVDFSFTVTAEDGETQAVYTVAVTRLKKESTPSSGGPSGTSGGTTGNRGNTSKSNSNSSDKTDSGKPSTSAQAESAKPPDTTVNTADTVYVTAAESAPYDARADRFETMAIVLISVGAGMGFVVFVQRFGKSKDDDPDR